MADFRETLIYRWLEAGDAGDLDAFDDLLLPDAVIHAPRGLSSSSCEAEKSVWQEALAAMPDLRHDVQEVLVGRDVEMARVVVTGTMSTAFAGVDGSGGSFRMDQAVIAHLRDGKIEEAWEIADVGRLESQMTDTGVEVIEAHLNDKMVMRNLLELYQHDFSEFDGAELNERGLYGYRYLDNYWIDDDRRPFLFRVDGHWAGFGLVRLGDPNDVAEFFVLRKYRRRGIGKIAARHLFERFPGAWQVRQNPANVAATAFWRQAIPVEFVEHVTETGPVQHFVIAGAH